MRRRPPLLGVLTTLLSLLALAGCHPQQPFYFREDGDLSHYIGLATDLEVPDLEEDSLGEVEGAIRPFSLAGEQPQETWDLGLEEAIRCALANSKVMRSIGGQILGPPDFIARNPEIVPTVYDPAITESNPRYGVEAALSAFDAQFTSSLFWEKNDRPQNTAGYVTQFRPQVTQQDLGTFQAVLSKTAATGGTWSLTHNVRYDKNNNRVYTEDGHRLRLYGSDWNVNLEAEFRQPLLQGWGVQFNRIAGPGAIPGYNNGVMLARINTDIALTDFESGVRDLVSDVEMAYWELYFAYRNLDAVIAGRDSALQTWRKIHALYVVSARGGEAEKEAQAREQYFLFRSSVEESLNSLYATESKLRYLMGLAATDGRLIRPADEPTTAKLAFDWYEALGESLCRSVELRDERWLVKRRELELISAKNYLLPRLDAVGTYRWLGMGDELINSNGSTGDFTRIGSNAYETMTGGNFHEWQLGFEFNFPIGFRKEMAGVRHAQLNLARERARLQELELEVSHQLAYAIRDLEANYVLSRTNFNRRVAAQRQVEAVEAAYETETVTLDLLLDAQRRLAQAESAFYRSVVDYNKSIADVHYRKGSLLEYNGIQLAEGPWPGKAYFDAHGRARARDASLYLDYGYTRPKVISRGSYNQHPGGGPMQFDGAAEPAPEPAPELISAPEPEIIEPPVPVPLSENDSPTAAPKTPAPKTPAPSTAAQQSVRQAGHYESLAHPSAAEGNRPAPGWKGLQR